MGLFKKVRDLRRAFEQGIENANAAAAASAGLDELHWLADKPLRGAAGQWVYGQHLSSARRESLPSPVTLAPDREGQQRAELEARIAARAPYLASDRETVRVTRIATSERQQVEDVSGHLARTGFAGRPDLVFGLYRVPDHIDAGRLVIDRLVEWDIVHRDVTGLPPAPPPTVAWFDARETWVRRRIGEPMVYDEDLALEYFAQAGVGPEDTIGISRFLAVEAGQGATEASSSTLSYVRGVHAWHRPGVGGDAYERLRSTRPIVSVPSPDVRVVVLSWSSIRRAVTAESGAPALSPSPFPYLPSTAQELLCAYLDIVGVRSADCFAASVTEDVPRNLDSVTYRAGITLTTNRGAAEPCVDGVERPRLRGGARVVVVYRDRPEYTAGRERFDAYQREVLSSQLELGVERRPLEYHDQLDRLPGGLRKVVDAAYAIADFVTFEPGVEELRFPHFRYCWPPSSSHSSGREVQLRAPVRAWRRGSGRSANRRPRTRTGRTGPRRGWCDRRAARRARA